MGKRLTPLRRLQRFRKPKNNFQTHLTNLTAEDSFKVTFQASVFPKFYKKHLPTHKYMFINFSRNNQNMLSDLVVKRY